MKKPGFSIKLNLPNFKLLAKFRLLCTFTGLLFLSANAFASTTGNGSNLPFVTKLHDFALVISGPVALSIAIALTAATGLMNALGEFGDGMKKLLTVVFWVGLVFSVTSLMTFLGSDGATF